MRKALEYFAEDLCAQRELNMVLPLTDADYDRLEARIPYVPLVGEPFDDKNRIFPLMIPQKPISYLLAGSEDAYSLLLRYNNQLVSVIGDSEMRELYIAHTGNFFYGVGVLVEKHKNGKRYVNIKLRGWVFVKIKERKSISTGRSSKK